MGIALGQCLGTPADEVPLASTPDGQPRLAGCALSTSLSHSGSTVALSVASSITVGVDIEQMPAKIDLEALAPMFCTPREAADLRDFLPAARKQRLMELWTRKEALLKAEGRGLAYGLHRVVVELGESAPVLREFGDESLASWQLQELSLGPDWVSAIAWHGPPMRLRWRGGFG